MDSDDDELAEAIDELADTISDLRRELETDRRRPPIRPPTPRELLRVADEVAIPTLVAILEANVRALRAFQHGLRLVRRERDVRERTTDTHQRTRERAAELRESTLTQLDAALSQLQRAVASDELDRTGPTTDLIDDARRLRDEIDRQLADALDGRGTDDLADTDDGMGRTIEIRDEPVDVDDATSGKSTRDDETNVDVDAELETLKDRYGAPDEGESDEPESDDAETGPSDDDPSGDEDSTDTGADSTHSEGDSAGDDGTDS